LAIIRSAGNADTDLRKKRVARDHTLGLAAYVESARPRAVLAKPAFHRTESTTTNRPSTGKRSEESGMSQAVQRSTPKRPDEEQELTDGFHLVLDGSNSTASPRSMVPGIPITDFGAAWRRAEGIRVVSHSPPSRTPATRRPSPGSYQESRASAAMCRSRASNGSPPSPTPTTNDSR